MINTSGYSVPEYRILILPDVVEEKTAGGIIIPDSSIDDMQGAKTLATIVDIGEKAFDQGTDREWKKKPKVGDKILIPSYEGYRLSKDQTKDGKEYRIILDRNILAIQIIDYVNLKPSGFFLQKLKKILNNFQKNEEICQ